MNKLYAMVSRLLGVPEHKVSEEVRNASHRLANESQSLTASVDKAIEKSADPLGDLVSAMRRSKGRPEN